MNHYIILIRDSCGIEYMFRALLDSGSQITAITKDCTNRLGLICHKYCTEILGLYQCTVTKIKRISSCSFQPLQTSDLVFKCNELIVLPQMTSGMPAISLTSKVCIHYQHLPFASKV